MPCLRNMIDNLFDIGALDRAHGDVLIRAFSGFDEWRGWLSSNSWATDPSYIAKFAENARKHGLSSLWFGRLSPADIDIRGEAPDIGIVARSLSEIERMLLDLVAAAKFIDNPMTVRIYAAEAQSAWALQMRGRFPRFIGSSYFPEDPRSLFPIAHQDVAALTYPSCVFDVAVTIEVLEHVPTIETALFELCRVLRPGGVLLSTIPFLYMSEVGEVKARLVNGELQHLVAVPEYHADPHRVGGALVFHLPGWDLLDLARAAGFRDARFVFYSTASGGVCSPHLAGRFALVCRK